MSIAQNEQLEYIKLWETSGLSKAEFCRQMGITYTHFNAWHYRIKHRDRPHSGDHVHTKIVPVTVTNEKIESEQTYLILRIKSSVLEIPPGFPDDQLRNIIEILL